MIEYLRAIWRCRYFWFNLVRMDLRTRYRRSVLGLGWSLLHPIAMTAIFCVVFQTLMMPEEGVAKYAPYLLAGLATWNFIMSATMQGCHCFFQGESYIRQYPAPMAIYPLRTALGSLIHFLIALTVVVVMVCAIRVVIAPPASPAASQTQVAPASPGEQSAGAAARQPQCSWRRYLVTLAWLVPAVLMLLLFAWSMAVLAGVANVYFQDTQHLCEVGFQMLLYMTPIFYPKKLLVEKGIGWMAEYNPIAAFLDLVRNPVLEGRSPSATTLTVACSTLLVAMVGAMFTLSRCQRRLIFQL
jgi:ABC-type polysaccharide/polyol phosphate export permease